MKRVVVSLVLVMAVAPAWAALSDQWRGWADGPEGFLLTDAERAAWSQITDDQAAEAFVELFWAKRDPDLTTRENEFRSAFESRVEAANAEFGEKDLRGALTDRGRTLILLGVPKENVFSGIGEYLAGLYRTGRAPQASSHDVDAHIQMQGVSFNVNKGRAHLWAYTREQIPETIEWPTKSDRITFAFFDHEGDGHYRMQLGILHSAEAAAVLAAAPAALVVNPDLMAPPVYGLMAGVPPATAEDLAALDAEATLDGVVAELSRGTGGPGTKIGWLAIRTPKGAAPATALVGRLSAGGNIVGSFHLDVTPKVTALGSFYAVALPVADTASTLDVGLVGAAGMIDSRRLELEPEDLDGAHLTPVFAGAEVEKEASPTAGDPFVFGGYDLIPRPDGRYRAGENVALFCLLTVPEATNASSGARPGTVRMRWYVDGKPKPVQPAQVIPFVPVGSSTWVWGTQLPLAALNAGSSYELKVTIRDSGSDVSKTTRIPVNPIAD